MPLEHGASKEAFSHNVETEMTAGKPQKQAVAIAYSEKQRAAHDAAERLCSGVEALCSRMDAAFTRQDGVGEGGFEKGPRMDADFEESKHPRASDGKFGTGGDRSGPVTVQESKDPPFVTEFFENNRSVPKMEAYLKDKPTDHLQKARSFLDRTDSKSDRVQNLKKFIDQELSNRET